MNARAQKQRSLPMNALAIGRERGRLDAAVLPRAYIRVTLKSA